jgi:lipopolysaccharide transport system ATP-binding protein
MNDDVLIKVEGVSKKFCRSLKKSLYYGLKDIAGETTGFNKNQDQLRSEEFWAVNDVSFELRRGECLGLIGRNGAGKTTLLKMLNGLIKPNKGRIEMHGRIGALIALGAGFNPILTGRENIYVNASILGLCKKESAAKFEEIVHFAELNDFIDTPVQNYSSGMQVRLGFAVAAVLIKPDVLLLDEVLAVGDMGFKIKCLNSVRELMADAAVVFVSHTMQFVSQFCSRIACLL